MDLEQLELELMAYGNVELCRAGYVFTLLLIGENLDNFQNSSKILNIVVKHTKDKYPIVECIKNTENYFCIILKP